jgi:hypothetical protein
VLLRGIAQGHIGRRYCSLAECNYRPDCLSLTRVLLPSGHYEIQQWNEHSRNFVTDNTVSLSITVDETFDDDHRIVSQKGETKGRFTFTAGDSGTHKLCFTSLNHVAHTGWLKGGQEVGGIKLTLDMVVGETSNIESTDKGKINDIVSKVKDLNGRLQDIRREQIFQRVRALSPN